MKSILICVSLCLLPIAATSIARADDAKAPATVPQSQEEMMKMMAELGKPGPEHEGLQKMVGDWDCTVTDYPMFPGGKETTSSGKAVFTSKFGGRYVEQKFSSEFGGMKYEGCGELGYDKIKKVYTSTWFDNFSTQTMYAEGSFDPATKTATYVCEMVCPLGKLKHKMVMTSKSDDEMTFEMYAQMPGATEMTKGMQIVYKRAK